MKILISGAALSGNKGAMAMAVVTIAQLKKRYPDCSISLLSKYPSQDRANCRKYGVGLVAASPSKLVSSTLLRSGLKILVKKFLSADFLNDEIMEAYQSADLLIDIGGITFSDDREWKGRALSVGWILPAMAADIPVVKLSQAMGPFRRTLTKLSGRKVLNYCSVIIARGQQSESHVKNIMPDHKGVYCCDDLAFLLEKAENSTVRDYLEKKNLPLSGFAGITPSAVVYRKAKKNGNEQKYLNAICEIIKYIRDKYKIPVVMVPHAWPQSGKGTEDLEICYKVQAMLDDAHSIHIVEDDLDCNMLKGIIGQSHYFIASRFHSMIAALSTNTPTMVMGWGHKYKEIMNRVRAGNLCVDFSQTDVTVLKSLVDDLHQNRAAYEKGISDNLESIKESSMSNYSILDEFIQNGLK